MQCPLSISVFKAGFLFTSDKFSCALNTSVQLKDELVQQLQLSKQAGFNNMNENKVP